MEISTPSGKTAFKEITADQFNEQLNKGDKGIKRLESLGSLYIKGNINFPKGIVSLPDVPLKFEGSVYLENCELERFKGEVEGRLTLVNSKVKVIDDGTNIKGPILMYDCDIEELHARVEKSDVELRRCKNIKKFNPKGEILRLRINACEIDSMKVDVNNDFLLEGSSVIGEIEEGSRVKGDFLAANGETIYKCNCGVDGSVVLSWVTGLNELDIVVGGNLQLNYSEIKKLRCNVGGNCAAWNTANLKEIRDDSIFNRDLDLTHSSLTYFNSHVKGYLNGCSSNIKELGLNTIIGGRLELSNSKLEVFNGLVRYGAVLNDTPLEVIGPNARFLNTVNMQNTPISFEAYDLSKNILNYDYGVKDEEWEKMVDTRIENLTRIKTFRDSIINVGIEL